MLRILSLALLFLASSSAVMADTSVWKISKGGRDLYLAGTVHVLSKNDYPLPKEFQQAYANSSLLVFEVDMQATETPAFQQQVMHYGLYPQGQNIQSKLKPDTLYRLQQHLQSQGINFQAWSQFKPGLLSIMLTMRELNALGIGEDGVDKFFMQKALADNKQIAEFETMEQQLNLLANMGLGMEDDMIRQSLDDLKQISTLMPELLKAWRLGDEQTLARVGLADWKKDYPRLYQSLLVQRNLNWIPQLETYLQTQATEMVLVGTLHLVGEDGLLAYLRTKGYKVTQL